VRNYVPDYTIKSDLPGEHNTSLLQLATHESGLPRECPANAKFILSHYQFVESSGKTSLINPCSEEEFIQALSNIDFEYKPFEYQQYSSYYSNVGYELLGIALEKATGEDYAKTMAKNIFEPLGMHQTGFVENNLDRKKLDLPQGYIFDQNTGKHIKTPYLLTDSYYHCAGMYSTTEDLAKFLISFFDYDTCYQNQILSPDAIRMMRKLNIGWNFQWYPEYPMIGHGGSYLGYRSYITLIPELKIGWIFLTNQYDYKNIIDLGILNNTLRDIIIPLVTNSSSNNKELFSLARFTGTYYVLDKSQKMKIYVENDTLKYYNELYTSEDNTLIRKSNLHFAESAGFNYNFKFLIDKNEIKILKMGDLIWYKE
jgi:CubicO group peptidase (beta-lactamase class C family)